MTTAPSTPPPTLYKYLSPDRADVLENLRIRFTQVSALNDPFEALPRATLAEPDWYLKKFRLRIEAEIRQLGIKSEAKRKQYWRMRKKEFPNFLRCYTDKAWLHELSQSVQHMSDTVQGCLSISATSRNILMWSHYAKNHQGYVIGFHAEHEYFGKSTSPVKYSDERPLIDPFESSHDGALFHTKSADWSYELEYRKYQSFVAPITLKNGNTLLPYTDADASKGANEAIVLFPLPSGAISCVILGWKASQELKNSLVRALEVHNLNQIPIYAAMPSLTRYEMEINLA